MGAHKNFLIVLSTALLLALVWATEDANYRAYVAERFAASDEQAGKLAIAFEQHTQNILNYADLRLSTVRAEYQQRGGLLAARQLLAALPFDEKIATLTGIADASGVGRAVDGNIPADSTYSIADRDYFIFHRDHPEDVLMVSPPVVGRLVPELTFRLSRRISAPDGSFAGVVFLSISPKVVTDFYDRFDIGANGSVALLRTDHVLIARRGPTADGEQPLGRRMEGRLWERVAESPAGASREASPADGITRLFAYRRLPNAPLLINVGVADSDVVVATRGYRLAAIATAAIASLVVLLGAAAVWRQTATSQRLRVVSERATRLSAQISSILNTSTVSILHLKNRKIIFANHQAHETFGYDEGEMVGRDTRILYPSEAEYLAAADDYPKLLAGPVTGREGEFRRKDGGACWCRSAGRLIDPADPSAGMIWVLDDVTERKMAEDALRESERRYRQLVQHSPVGIFHYGNDLRIAYCNRRFSEILGVPVEDLLGLDMAGLADSALLPTLKAPLEGRTDRYAGPYNTTLSETPLWVAMVAAPMMDSHGQITGGVGIVEDISERMRTEESLRQLSQVVEQGPIAVIITDIDGIIQYVNPEFCAKSGYRSDEVVGQNPRILSTGDKTREEYALMWSTIRQGRPWRGIFRNRRKDGSHYWEEAVIAPVRDQGGVITHFIAIKQDVTERKAAEAHVEFLAHHDALTGLPNRVLVRDRWTQAVAYAERSGNKVGLMFLDLDNFKSVNDALGHPAGDHLLRGVASRLRECVRETDTVSRQGGDEFLVVLSDIRDAEAVGVIAEKIEARMAAAFEIAGQEVVTSLSIGLCLHPDDGDDFDALLQRADMAMYHAKEAGRNTHRFYTEQMNVDADAQLRMRTSLRRALSRGEFALHYQPQLGLEDGEVIGVEALIRWNHPELGLLPPSRFIPIAEESGLIVPIGEWVLNEACRQAAEWQRQGLPYVTVAVNLSALQFKQGDLLAVVTRALTMSQLSPAYLELELTESILIQDVEAALKTVAELKALGVKLSIDDFGTGYSSLSYLKRFDVDKLKIDQSFVRDISDNANDSAIVSAIVQMARSLGLKTIAEGVEDARMLECLRSHDCDEVQGYHFARPMPPDQVRAFLAKGRAVATAAAI